MKALDSDEMRRQDPVQIVILGDPVAQGRPKTAVLGKNQKGPFDPSKIRACIYDPKDSRAWKQMLSLKAQGSMAGRDLLTGPLELTVRAYRPIPKQFSKKKIEKAEQGLIRPITKPDLSNYIKGVEDALNAIVFSDDSAIVQYGQSTGKYYSVKPRTEITIRSMLPNSEA